MTVRMNVLLVGLSAVAPIALPARPAPAQEEEITLDQVPAEVKATIERESAGGTVTEIERETKDGKVTYEVEFLRGGQEIELQIAPDGAVLRQAVEQPADDEDDLTIDQVPEPARSVLLGLAGGATITEAEREREDGVLVYEAAWTKDGTKYEAAVTEDGTLVELEELIPLATAPPAVRAAVAKHFGPNAQLTVAKKMIVAYEVEARVNGQEQEILVLPTGRVHQGEADDQDDDRDDDEDDGPEDDDDEEGQADND